MSLAKAVHLAVKHAFTLMMSAMRRSWGMHRPRISFERYTASGCVPRKMRTALIARRCATL